MTTGPAFDGMAPCMQEWHRGTGSVTQQQRRLPAEGAVASKPKHTEACDESMRLKHAISVGVVQGTLSTAHPMFWTRTTTPDCVHLTLRCSHKGDPSPASRPGKQQGHTKLWGTSKMTPSSSPPPLEVSSGATSAASTSVPSSAPMSSPWSVQKSGRKISGGGVQCARQWKVKGEFDDGGREKKHCGQSQAAIKHTSGDSDHMHATIPASLSTAPLVASVPLPRKPGRAWM